jgi:hypothetical protein
MSCHCLAQEQRELLEEKIVILERQATTCDQMLLWEEGRNAIGLSPAELRVNRKERERLKSERGDLEGQLASLRAQLRGSR